MLFERIRPPVESKDRSPLSDARLKLSWSSQVIVLSASKQATEQQGPSLHSQLDKKSLLLFQWTNCASSSTQETHVQFQMTPIKCLPVPVCAYASFNTSSLLLSWADRNQERSWWELITEMHRNCISPSRFSHSHYLNQSVQHWPDILTSSVLNISHSLARLWISMNSRKDHIRQATVICPKAE